MKEEQKGSSAKPIQLQLGQQQTNTVEGVLAANCRC